MKTTTRSVRKRNAKDEKRKRKRNTRNMVVAMKTLKKTLISVVRAITRMGAVTESKRATVMSAGMNHTVVKVANIIVKSAQAIPVVVRKAVRMVVILTALAVVVAVILIGRGVLGTETRRVQAMDFKRAPATNVKRLQVTAEIHMALEVATNTTRSRLVIVVVATSLMVMVGDIGVVMRTTNMVSAGSMEENKAAVVEKMTRDMAEGIKV
jgi:hypothetical protein